MAIPTYDELMYPVLKVLGDGFVRSGDEITNIVAEQLQITEEEKIGYIQIIQRKSLKTGFIGLEPI